MLPQQHTPVIRSGHYFIASNDNRAISQSDTCVSADIDNQGKVCIDIPVVGKQCIPVKTPFPSGTAAKACIDVCTKFGIPTGACATVTVLGQRVAKECFGAC
ncbi:hypothetical protein [Vibrio cionasavignyae]|uniref:hypothetical protein n=1 Tax=Vibrio cionasavignyae TaxID=2910252 RepID=UPI003D0FC580